MLLSTGKNESIQGWRFELVFVNIFADFSGYAGKEIW